MMAVRLLTSADDLARYESWVQSHPQGSLWQSLAWKRYQEALGRETRVYIDEAGSASALVSIDRTAWELSTWDIPRGPLWNSDHSPAALLKQIMSDAKKDRCITLYASPIAPLPAGITMQSSGRHVYPTATRIVDLTADENTILARMRPKGRYNIGVAERHGVRVEQSTDVEAFHALVQTTAARDRFRPLPLTTYKTFLNELPGAFFLAARHADAGDALVAGLMGVQWGSTGIYYYGASSYEHRALMGPYALQWAAMRRCKAAGCTQYDLLGIAPPDAGPSHPWQGVSIFKEKFGGTLVTYPHERRKRLKKVTGALLAMKRRFG